MDPRPVSLVVGGGGLLGSAVLAELKGRGLATHTLVVPWEDTEAAVAALATKLETLARSAAEVMIWWCAGSGVTATTADELAAELSVIERFADSVARVAVSESCRLTVFFASSAGGVYAGSAEPPFTEFTDPAPLSAYGALKLEAEKLFGGLVGSGVGVAIARIANLYGPGQDLTKQQGLISQLCLAAQLGRPLNIYVSLDTMRDYIYSADAAGRCVDYGLKVAVLEPTVICKIIATGQSVTIGALIGEANRIFRHRIPVVMAASPLRRQQARDLRLRSVVLPELDRRSLRTLGSGMGMVRRAVEAHTQASVRQG